MISGIYMLFNKVTNDFYIGSSFNVSKRIKAHFSLLKNNKHHSTYLQNAYNKYGKNNFDFVIIEICTEEALLNREQYYLDNLSPSYNTAKISGSPMKGRKHKEETIMKIKNREFIKGEKHPLYGKKLSEETKEKQRLKKIGSKRSEETKRKMSETSKRLNRFKDIQPYVEKQKRKVIDSNNIIYNSLIECAQVTGHSVQAVCDNLKGRSKKLRSGLVVKYYEDT